MKKSIIRKIDKSKVVSFDIYDTLIKRIFKVPSDVFQVVENVWNDNNEKKIKNFKSIRYNAEKNCRNNKKEEITLKNIYDEIEKQLGKIAFQLMEIEIKIEIECVFLNKEVIDIYNYCVKQQKKIIITSDMYLDRKTIDTILNNFGIKYDELFLSSELGFKKSNGKIFDVIINKLKLKSKEILHIGDNLNSDFFQARLKGVNTIYTKNNKKKLKYENILKNIIEKNYRKKENEYYEFGYKILGPLMYGFSKYIEKIYFEKSMNKIVFLAREGAFIKDCFEKFTDKDIFCDYIYVSRKSISSSIIYDKNIENINKIIDMQSVALNETVEMFLNRFNLLNERNKEFFEKNMINLNSSYYKNKDFIKYNFQNLLDDELIGINLFKEYLIEKKIDSNTLLVDIGWNGTMQDLIKNELNNCKIHAVYLGVRKKRKNSFKHGFLMDGDNEEIEIYSRGMVALLEILFSANHGTTVGYIKSKEIEPVIKKNEIEQEQMKMILEIQNGAKMFIMDAKKNKLFDYLNIEDKDYIEPILNIGINPDNKSINLFKNFKVNNEKIKQLIGGEKGIFYYIINFKEFKNDFFDSGWKIAFLKNVFRINISYKKIYRFIYKLKK